jgi:DNA-binding NarL/FixJ family response regulator
MHTSVWLIDDHALLRNGLANIINGFDGYRVIAESDNGADFIEQVSDRAAPDIVLLDITMPVMNGYDTASWIKTNLPKTCVLVLSMMDSDLAIIKMLKLGAKGYLLKDSKPDVFRRALDCLRNGEYFINDLVSNKMLSYVKGEGPDEGKIEHPDFNITDRELAFIKLACSEKTFKEIALEMCVSPRTVDSYRDSLFEKLGVNTRVGLVLFAIKNGIYAL